MSLRPLLNHAETERTGQDTLTTTVGKLRYCQHLQRLEQQEVDAYITLQKHIWPVMKHQGQRTTTRWTSRPSCLRSSLARYVQMASISAFFCSAEQFSFFTLAMMASA